MVNLVYDECGQDQANYIPIAADRMGLLLKRVMGDCWLGLVLNTATCDYL